MLRMRPLPITDLEQLEASNALAQMRTYGDTGLPGVRVVQHFLVSSVTLHYHPDATAACPPLLIWSLPACTGDGSRICCARNGCHPVCNCTV